MIHSFTKSMILTLCLALGAEAQSPLASKTTHVLAMLRVGEGANITEIRKTMPAEIRATVQLYLEGRIVQWFSRSDGRGVVFILDCKSVEEAKALLSQLPLVKEHGASFDFVALSPLRPLQLLMEPSTKN
jgi:hypothetical protein